MKRKCRPRPLFLIWLLPAAITITFAAAETAQSDEQRTIYPKGSLYRLESPFEKGASAVADYLSLCISKLSPTDFFDDVVPCSGSYCSGSYCGGCFSDGIFLSAELGIVGVAQSDVNNIPTRLLQSVRPAAASPGTNGFGFDAAPRLALGYMTCEGLGVRGRLWNYNNAESVSLTPAALGDPTGASHSLEMTVFDLEFVQAISSPVWAGSFSGGYRASFYKEEAALAGGAFPTVTSRYVGNGLTGAMELRRPITQHFSLMNSSRASILLGDSRVDTTAPQGPLNNDFDIRYVLETQLGVSYERPVAAGVWFVRGGYEVQYWDDFVAAIGGQSDLSWTLFHGAFFAVGLQR